MHYEMPLPFRKKNVQLPINHPQAEQRLQGLKKRLQGDARYRADYCIYSTISRVIFTQIKTEVS